jgi:hypothetical protein
MEPHREEPQKALPPSAEQKPKRFRIVKLEERIAPSKGGAGTNNGCVSGHITACGPGCHVYSVDGYSCFTCGCNPATTFYTCYG